MTVTVEPTFTSAGALSALLADGLSLLQYPASELEPGPHQVWLRRRTDAGPEPLGLTGPASGASVVRTDAGVTLRGLHRELRWELWWDAPADGLFGWTLRVTNEGPAPVVADAVWTVDAALTEPDALRRSEFYVAQYLDVTPVTDAEGTVLAVRQNMPGDAHPWLALTVTRPLAGWCTDALQLRADAPGTGLDLGRDLPSQRLQHEHTLVGLQVEAFELAPGASEVVGFRGLVLADHPERTSPDDAALVRDALAGAAFADEPTVAEEGSPVAPTPFSPVHWAHGEKLDEAAFEELAGDAVLERGPDGRPWAALDGDRHVVAAAKEGAVLRPHGHILRASAGPGPQDVTVASTAWLAGTFASQVTVGHSCDAPLVSVRRSYLGLTQAEGVRVFVRDGGPWRLLGVPSAWEAREASCTWWYRRQERLLVVTSELRLAEVTVRVQVAEGEPLDLRLFARCAGGDVDRVMEGTRELRHAIGLAADTASTEDAEHEPDAATAAWQAPRLASGDPGAARLGRMLPWLVGNALVHYQAPRGLEQFTGGAWGTRDVCQGPVGLLVATGRFDVWRAVVLTTFAAQHDDGDWPQWFQYLAAHRAPESRDSHGDVVYWPLLALGEYLEATGDASVLDEAVGWVGATDLLDASPVRDHVAAAVEHLAGARSDDPRLPAYGHGDWNDALQPASPELARSLVSTWTTTLEIKACRTLAAGLGAAGRAADPLLVRLEAVAAQAEAALRERLLVDGELCGYAVVTHERLEPLVHPDDRRTGLAHGSLQMIHALADELLTPQEAADHLRLIDAHLDGPAGIYLFDRPVTYHGGETRTFLRAEAASYWGREIGLMYTHAHIRWVEALVRLGLADRAWAALQLVLPEGLRAAVPGAVPTQSNCYHSSVDALFADRYAAQESARDLFDASTRFAGGWRVYSSGSGLVLRLVTEGFLGLRVHADGLEVDPVLPASLDGLEATVSLGGREARVRYIVGAPGCGVRRVEVNGSVAEGEPVARRYRAGGVRIARDAWASGEGPVELRIVVGGDAAGS